MSEAVITYERDGVQIIVYPGHVTVKKNGLSIDIPTWMIEDFSNEFDKALDHEMEVLRKLKNGTLID